MTQGNRLVLAVAVLALSATAVRAACTSPSAIMNFAAGSAKGGAFSFAGTGYENKGVPGPPVRFWAFNNFTKANSGTALTYDKGNEWLVNPALDYKAKGMKPGQWVGFQMNWMSPGVEGCITDMEPARTVVEFSFADPAREGTKEHAGYYAAVSVDHENWNFDLDRLSNAQGGHDIPVSAIAAPKIDKVEAGKDHTVVTVQVQDPVSFSEGGPNKPVTLVAGTRLYYKSGDEPRSSLAEGWLPVMDPADGKKELGLVALGKGRVQVAVPGGSAPVWLAARVQYADAGSVLLSTAVSSHVRVAAGGAASGGRERRGDKSEK